MLIQQHLFLQPQAPVSPVSYYVGTAPRAAECWEINKGFKKEQKYSYNEQMKGNNHFQALRGLTGKLASLCIFLILQKLANDDIEG